MGSQQTRESEEEIRVNAFGAKELYNLRQVYYYLCLHTTTLTSCPLDRTQFQSLFGSQTLCKPLWEPLFNAIDIKGDDVIDFEEFLLFVTHLKRGDADAKRKLCFRLFDASGKGYAERRDVQPILDTGAGLLASLAVSGGGSSGSNSRGHRLAGAAGAGAGAGAVEDYGAHFFALCDEDQDGRISAADLETYCAQHGEGVLRQTIHLLEALFDAVTQETGITITETDVRNTKPHIDWQDHKIGMGSLLCCSTSGPTFTTPPVR